MALLSQLLILLIVFRSSLVYSFSTNSASVESGRESASSSLIRRMSDGYLDRGDRGFFTLPLFQDFEFRRLAGGNPLQSSATRMSNGIEKLRFFPNRARTNDGDQPRHNDDEDEEEEEEEFMLYRKDTILSYLPSRGRDMQQKTKRMLKRVTRRYIYHDNMGDAPIKSATVLKAIDAEYKPYDLPVAIGNQTFSFRNTGIEEYRDIAKILSFAALFRIPEEITLLLFGEDDGVDDSPLSEGRRAFAKVGWKGVRFARGISIGLQRRLLPTFRSRYSPISRVWMTNRNTESAHRMVQEASHVVPPARQLMSPAEFLASVDVTLSNTKHRSPRQMIKDAMLFFPRQRQTVTKLRQNVLSTMQQVALYGRNFVFTYALLTCCWSTFGLWYIWRNVSTPAFFSAYTGYLTSSFQRFAKTTLSLGVRTRLWRIGLSFLLAPLSGSLLRRARNRLEMSMAETVGVLSILMLWFTAAAWSILVFADATVARALAL